jgi:5'-nucleotidase (lipoprotein e(P4) family)
MKKIRVCFIIIFVIGIAQVNCQVDKTKKYSEAQLKIFSTLWHQQSAEYKALCFQAYNLASERINKMAGESYKGKPRAIITDCDETILDNSPLYARLIMENKEYNHAEWKSWTDLSMAEPIPGSVEFFQLAHNLGFTIFYVSNRDTSEVENTLKNLINLGFPDALKSNMLFMSTTSSKEERRQMIMKNYDIVMLLGDNLNDFSDIFRRKTVAERSYQTDISKEEWGKKFIVLPNDIYGEWENAFYNYNSNLTVSQKDSCRMELLKSY